MIDLITTVNRMPRKGETVEAPHFDLGFGGKGANQAVAAALLGAEVAMITKVGDDMFGREVKRNFEAFGIDSELVEKVPNISNGVAPIFVDSEGNNSILIVKGANAFFSRSDIDKALVKINDSDLVLLQLEIPIDTVHYAIEVCSEQHIPVLLNPAPGAKLSFESVRKVSFFVPNETELEIITGMPVATLEEIKKAALWLVEGGVNRVIVTLGERGSMLVTDDESILIPAFKVQPRDTTGAGDAFIGSFAYFYTVSGEILKAMSYANHYAALSTLRVGTQKSFYSSREFAKARNNVEDLSAGDG